MLPPANIGKVSLALLLTLVALTDARTLPGRSKQVKVYSYVLPAGAEEIRDDINHSFACANRSDGFYVDIDNDCQIFHRCQDRARFSFICAERTVFSQMYQTCVHDGQLGYPCEDSAEYYPEGEGYEPSAAGSEQAQESVQPERVNAAPVPSKSSEMIVTPPKATDDGEANTMKQTQDNTQQTVQATVVTVEEANDEEEQSQDETSQHQVNADLFDSIEDDTDVSSENSAQEVLDEAEPAHVSSVGPTETTSSDATTSQEDTQEVEVLDDSTQQGVQEEFVALEPSPTSQSSDASQVSELADLPVELESGVEDGVPAAMEDMSTQSVQGALQYAGDSLLNAIQTVEELEPIVHDIVVEHADSNELQPQVAEMEQSPVKVDSMEEGNNEVLPELDSAATADMETAPLAQIALTGPSKGEVSLEAVALPESGEESDQQVNELSPESELTADAADTADESSETIVSSAMDATDSDEPEQLASEPETADVKLDSTDEELQVLSSPSEDQQAAGEQQTSVPVVVAEPLRPLESPAIVEEMAPHRPNDSVELPELIVSTEFHLDAATQGPAIRRRKTFLFRADAIRLRQ